MAERPNNPSVGPSSSVPDMVERVLKEARRDIMRTQTDFLGRMSQALEDYSCVFDDAPNDVMSADATDDAIEAISALASLALAQLAMLSTSTDEEACAALAAIPASAGDVVVDQRRVELVRRFNEAVEAMPPEVGARINLGQQFNAYEDARNEEDGEPDWWDFHLAIGTISDHRKFAEIAGAASARLIEAALKLATCTTLAERDRAVGTPS